MDQSNIDWNVRFADAEERSIFSILHESKIQRFHLQMMDNELRNVALTDYQIASLTEIAVLITTLVNGNLDKRYYDIIKTSNGWGIIRDIRGYKNPIDITVNETQTNNTGVLVLDVQGAGGGVNPADIVVLTNTKTHD